MEFIGMAEETVKKRSNFMHPHTQFRRHDHTFQSSDYFEDK